MKFENKLKELDINEVKKISAKYGKNKLIAEKLGISVGQLKYLRYNHKMIVHKEYRELAVKLSIAIEEGILQYKKNNLKKNFINPY